MYRVTYDRKRTDNTPIIDYLPECRIYGSVIHRFRKSQPGFVSFTHGVTDDQITLVGVCIWENEEAFNASSAAEELDEQVCAAKASWSEFCQEHDITFNISYETI